MKRRRSVSWLVMLIFFLQVSALAVFTDVSWGNETVLEETDSKLLSSWVSLAMRTKKLEEAASQDAVHFVLVMDESRTMNDSDSNKYCQSAVNMFIDMLPIENVEVGLIGFGNRDTTTAYPFEDKDFMPVEGHQNYVRRIHAPVNLSNSEDKDELKHSIDTIKWTGDQTLIDAGLLAGIDMLSVSEAPENKGCVIMLTDGDYRAYETTGKNDTVINKKAVTRANEHGWSVYCIELDYANSENARAEANQYLTSQITDNCKGNTYPVESSRDVSIAFMEIINSFYDSGDKQPVPINDLGYGSYTIEVPDLTSETNITIVSDTIRGVELKHGDTSVVIGDYNNDGTDETSYNQNEFIVNTGRIYYNIKMIVPDAGTWNVGVLAGPNTIAISNNISFSDLDMVSEIIPSGNTEDTALTRKEQIRGNIALTYHGKPVHSGAIGNAEAWIHVVNETTGDVSPNTEMLWNDDENRFEGVVNVADIEKPGRLSVWTEIKYAGGESKTSEPAVIWTKNDPVTIVPDAELHAEGYVRQRLEPISMEGMFENPDQDELYFKITGVEGDASVELNDERTAIIIDTGSQVMEYNGELLVWDSAMGEENAARLPFVLSVRNHKMIMKRIPDQNVVKKSDDIQITLDLKEYFIDEDQTDIKYTVVSSDESVMACSVDQQNGIMSLTAKEKGDIKITVSAPDDDGTEYSQAFEVHIIPWSSIIMRRITAAGSIIAVIAIMILIFSLIIKQNMLIRGVWKINYVYKGVGSKDLVLDIAQNVNRKKRHRTTLWKLIESYSIARTGIRQAENELDKLILKGVYKKKGCVIRSEIKDVIIDGKKLKKGQKVHLSYGTTKITVPVGSENLTITIEIK